LLADVRQHLKVGAVSLAGGTMPKPDIRVWTPARRGIDLRQASDPMLMHEGKPHDFWLAKNWVAFLDVPLLLEDTVLQAKSLILAG
jgi:carotenoid cleavage dioxygenase-like enzyme